METFQHNETLCAQPSGPWRAWLNRRPIRQQADSGSAAGHALGLDIERIDRLARGHEQAVALAAAETEVGAALGQKDAADQAAVGREHGDAVVARAARE